MKSLIKKAIQAIEEEKYERAVGLLEGALEISEDKPQVSSGITPGGIITEVQNNNLTPVSDSKIKNAANDPDLVTDAETAARLAHVQKMSKVEIA